MLCNGRGDLACPKTTFVDTCSTCGFVGSIPCPECAGKGRRPVAEPDVEVVRGAEPSLGETGSLSLDLASPNRSVGEPRASAASLSPIELHASVDAMRKAVGAAQAIREFKLPTEARRLREEVRRIRKKLTPLESASDASVSSGREAVAQELRKLAGTTDALVTRGETLVEALERAEKSRGKTQEALDRLTASLGRITEADASPEARADVRDRTDDLRTALSVAERTLKAVSPSAVATVAAQLKESAEQLKQIEVRIEDLTAAGRNRSGRLAAAKRRPARDDGAPEAGTEAESPAAATARNQPSTRHRAESTEGEEDAATETLVAPLDKRGRAPLVWGAGGLAVAALVGIYLRSRRRAIEIEEERFHEDLRPSSGMETRRLRPRTRAVSRARSETVDGVG